MNKNENYILKTVEQYRNANVTFTMTAGEMVDAFNHCVNATRQELEQRYATTNTERYLTINEVSEMLGYDKRTLDRWHKSGYLKRLKIGGGVRYRLSDVNRRIEEENPEIFNSN